MGDVSATAVAAAVTTTERGLRDPLVVHVDEDDEERGSGNDANRIRSVTSVPCEHNDGSNVDDDQAQQQDYYTNFCCATLGRLGVFDKSIILSILVVALNGVLLGRIIADVDPLVPVLAFVLTPTLLLVGGWIGTILASSCCLGCRAQDCFLFPGLLLQVCVVSVLVYCAAYADNVND